MTLAIAIGAGAAARSTAQESLWTYQVLEFSDGAPASQRRPVITALAATGEWLAAAGDDHRIWFWSPDDQRCLGAVHGHRDWVRCLAHTPDGSLLASGGNDGLVLVWDPVAMRRLQTLSFGTGAVTGLAFDRSGQNLFVAGFDGQVVLARISDGQVVNRRRLPDRDLRAITLIGGSSCTVVGGKSGALYAWSVTDDQLHVATAHRARVRCVYWSEDMATLYSAGEDGRIFAWPWPLSNQPRLVAQSPAPIYSMTAVASRIVVGCSDNTLRVVDPIRGNLLVELGDHTGSVSVVAAASDGGFFSAGYDTTLRKWQLSLPTSAPPQQENSTP